jgi:hypothetical protein
MQVPVPAEVWTNKVQLCGPVNQIGV